MSRHHELRDWYRFLGVATASDAAAELHRMICRLDEAYDIVNHVLKGLAGSPGGQVDDVLTVVRAGLSEAIDHLDETKRQMGYGDPDAA